MAIDLEPNSLREWLAAVGLLRLVSETTTATHLVWRRDAGRFRLAITDAPDDLAVRCADWLAEHRSAWAFAGKKNADFDAQFWRDQATSARGVELALWCAVASDGVLHRSGDKLKASRLEYAHGGGHQNWLASLRAFLAAPFTADDFSRLLAGHRNDRMTGEICRWDPDCERAHAYRAIAPTKDKMTQDQHINALAAIGFASCPTAPTARGLSSPLVVGRDELRWPIWTEPMRLADLEATLCCPGGRWPTMESRRWLSSKLYCFSRAVLRDTKLPAL